MTVQDLMRHTSGITYGGRGSTPVHKLWPASSTATAYAMTGTEFMDKIATLPQSKQDEIKRVRKDLERAAKNRAEVERLQDLLAKAKKQGAKDE